MKLYVTAIVLWGILLTSLTAAKRASGRTMTEKPISERISDRTFPSIFQAWNPADNLQENEEVTAARHDLIFHGASFFGLEWNNSYQGLATGFTPESIQQGRLRRKALLNRNPNLVLLMEIRYRDAHHTYLPKEHIWWRRNDKGAIVAGWEEGKYFQLDFSNPEFRGQVALQAKAAVSSGVVDGIMLDWWQDDEARLALIRSVRQSIGEQHLILVNANDRITPKTAPFINGYFMECYRSKTAEEWRRIADTLVWAEKNLQTLRINCLETWYHKSRADENLMRATTALSLVLSDGYCLFSDPNPLPAPDHLHNWYSFWNQRLGKAVAKGMARSDGSFTREFVAGMVIYNPMGNAPVTVSFNEPRISAATGERALSHIINPCDGDFFLKDYAAKPVAPADAEKPRR